HDALQGPTQRVRLVEQDRAVRPDRAAVVAAQQARDRLAAGLAHEVPEGDVDAADRVLHGAAAALPEAGLAERLGDPLRLDGRLALQQRPEQLDGPGDEPARGEATAVADEPRVGADDDQGVQVLPRLVALRPAAVDRGA